MNKTPDFVGIAEVVGLSGLLAQIGGEVRAAVANRPGVFFASRV